MRQLLPPKMRVPHRRPRLDECDCRAIIESATTLCMTANFSWRLVDGDPDQSFVSLAQRLQEARRERRLFPLPDTTRSWFDLRYANPDAAYALALVLLWAFGASRTVETQSGPRDYVSIAMWHLRVLLPHSAHGALPHIAAAYARHRSSLNAAARGGD